MGYETKLIVAELCELPKRGGGTYRFSLELARMNLSRAGDLPYIFTTPIDWKICGDGFEINSEKEFDMTEDSYGNICCYADIQTVIDELERLEVQEHYRRYTPAIAMLKAYAAEIWECPLIVIHYGY